MKELLYPENIRLKINFTATTLFLAVIFVSPDLCFAASAKSYADVSRKTSVSVNQMANNYGFRSITIYGKQITMQTRFNTLIFEGNSRRASFNGVSIWLNGPISKHWGTWNILQDDIDRTVLPLLAPNNALSSESCQIVVLDPGHGGDDHGAASRARLMEKNMTLELARKVRLILLQYRVDTRLTRNNDYRMDLDDRYKKANSWNSSVFISIHLNSAKNSSPAGIETHILPPAGYMGTANNSLGVYDQIACPANRYDRANMVLGYLLQRSLLKHTKAEDRGVRRSRFVVLKGITCPAALVECGFLSNRSEELKLARPEYLDHLARGIAEGIMAYLNGVKRANQGSP
jgi:N-acetylmuramoyl-L-alanine amidase